MSDILSVIMRIRCVLLFFFFFFKQKTAYEMRISDWSSDVCSSDLAGKIRAMQAANRVELHIVLTGLDGIAAGIEQGIWEDLTPYHSIIGSPSDIYAGVAA